MPFPRRRRRPRRLLLPAVLLLGALLAFLTYFVTHHGSAVAAIGDRSEYVDGACMAYGPTGTSRNLTVFIDPGHGGPDPGAIGQTSSNTQIDEKTATLAVALDLLPILRQDGFRVVLSRTGDTPVAPLTAGAISGGLYTDAGEHADLAARVDCANASGARLLLSIHFDSYDDPSVGGAETIYDPDRPFSADSRRFANLVQNAVLANLAGQGWTVSDRGVQSDTDVGTPALTAQGAAYGHLYLLGPAAAGWLAHPTTMPGVLCEPLFVTDPGEGAVAASMQGQQVLATAFAHAIADYFRTVPHGPS